MFICRVIVYSFISFFSKGNISFRILIINERDFNLSWFSNRSTEVSHLITPGHFCLLYIYVFYFQTALIFLSLIVQFEPRSQIK